MKDRGIDALINDSLIGTGESEILDSEYRSLIVSHHVGSVCERLLVRAVWISLPAM